MCDVMWALTECFKSVCDDVLQLVFLVRLLKNKTP